MKSGHEIIALHSGTRELARRDALAFLPPALEIIDTPPSPIGRAIPLTIVGAFSIALGWAILGELDIVASASGKIVPSGRTKVVQPVEIGVVRAIRVQDGQEVRAGDPLVELDPTIDNAEREHQKSDLVAAQLDIARLRAALSDEDDPLRVFRPPEDASPDLIVTQRRLLLTQTAEYRAKIAGIDRQRVQKEAERDAYAATIIKLQATIPLVQERVNIRRYLAQDGNGSKITYLGDLTDLTERQKELAIQQSHQREAEAALAALMENRAQTEAEYHRTRLDELVAAEQKAAGLAQDVIKATERSKRQLLTAPVDGIVQQLAVHTVGGVVTPAQQLLEVVPREDHVEIEAMVSNHDIGFVHAGQDAQVKIDTFNFTRYGLLHGVVQSVSADAITRDRPPGNANIAASSSDSASEPKGQEFVYAARVVLDRSEMDVDGKTVKLSPGMAVTVEIKTGARRVITYLLSPLLRFKQESMRER
jgi:hemolysin D